MKSTDQITVLEAYSSMIKFLEHYYNITKSCTIDHWPVPKVA